MNGKLPHPFPYQGSKRNIAPKILKFFPEKIERLIEPFAGSAAISIASAYHGLSKHFIINDLNKPLVDLLRMIVEHPIEIANLYEKLWNEQLDNPRKFYDNIREQFNLTGKPEYFLYLLPVKTTDEVSGGVWGRRPHTFGETTLLLSYIGL